MASDDGCTGLLGRLYRGVLVQDINDVGFNIAFVGHTVIEHDTGCIVV